MLFDLEKEMREAAKKLDFERAAELRDILIELRDVLELDDIPFKIESFDISNISGSFIVAGMCVAQNGVIKRNLFGISGK